MDDFVVARNPEEGSSLPFLVRLPLGRDGVILKVRDTWPRTSKIYAHAAEVAWPAQPDVVERVAVRSCVRRGASIDLVLDRAREHRSQFVFTRANGREVIFWQSARTVRQARPNVAVPTRRASGQVLHVLVDARERYAWDFARQQATTERRTLGAGDYAVALDGEVAAAVERKSLADLVSTLVAGRLHPMLGALAALPRAAVVVEDRWSAVFKLDRIRPAVVAEGLAVAQVAYPEVPIVFAETRLLAQEWTYRFLGAALAHAVSDPLGLERLEQLPVGTGPLPAPPPTARELRAWAQAQGLDVPRTGRIPAGVRSAWEAAHRPVP